MNMQINRFNSSPLEMSQLDKPLAPNAARQGAAAGGNATEWTPLDALNKEAGVKDGVVYKKKNLMQRRQASTRTQGQNRNTGTKKMRSKLNHFDDVVEDELDLSPVTDTLDLLGEDCGRRKRDEVEVKLAKNFSLLQRYNVLRDALHAVDQQSIGEDKKKAIKKALNEMMNGYPHNLRKALQETDDMVSSLDAIAGGGNGIRVFLNASKGNFYTPLKVLSTLRAMIKICGAGKCMQMMPGVRSGMMSYFLGSGHEIGSPR